MSLRRIDDGLNINDTYSTAFRGSNAYCIVMFNIHSIQELFKLKLCKLNVTSKWLLA